MGEEEDVQELEEAEREFIAYLEKAKEKEIQVCQTIFLITLILTS